MNLPFIRSLMGDRFLHLLIIIGVGLSFFVPFQPASWPAAIDWHTIITLSGLMLLTKGVEQSGYFDVLGRKMARRFVTERQLALFMVLAAALLSTFLTNDVALFIVVPLTLTGGQRRVAINAYRKPAKYSAVGPFGFIVPGLYPANAAACAGDDGDAAGAVLVLLPGEKARFSE